MLLNMFRHKHLHICDTSTEGTHSNYILWKQALKSWEQILLFVWIISSRSISVNLIRGRDSGFKTVGGWYPKFGGTVESK